MKSDHYLNLCLQQAALSPMHFRHGCIIVRGGKVIGQGFNDYRPGYDGGALKTGRLASVSLDGPAIANLKRKSKHKDKKKSPESFTPFETVSGMGGGHHANTPMSMHSEMMAIHSALSSSSTLAASTVSHQKPCFKLSGSSKRKSRLRQSAVKAHVERVCKDLLAVQQEQHQQQQQQQQGAGQAQANEWRFEASPFGQLMPERSLLSVQGCNEPFEEREREREPEREPWSWSEAGSFVSACG
ncbi:hypothetical protein BC567DRAFT_50686 [Phyllosticta citribraziliensis]